MEAISKLFAVVMLVITAGVICFVGWPLMERMRSEVTVYNLFCTKERVNGVCAGEEQTANPTSFKVYTEQQSVVSWVGDGGTVMRYESCAVRDVNNWHCRNGHFEHTMTNGDYIDSAEPPFLPISRLFYQGSRWRWWMLKMAQQIKSWQERNAKKDTRGDANVHVGVSLGSLPASTLGLIRKG